MRRSWRRHLEPTARTCGALEPASVLYGRLGGLRRGDPARPALRRQGGDPRHRARPFPPAALAGPVPPPHLRGLQGRARGGRAVSTRSATVEGVRLGRAGRGRQVLPEDLARGAVAEATARGVVESVGEPAEAGPPERLGLAVAGGGAGRPAGPGLHAPLLPPGIWGA